MIDVAGFKQPINCLIMVFGHVARRNHDPNGAGLAQLADQFLDRFGGSRASFGGSLRGPGAAIPDDHLMPALQQPQIHVRAHFAKPNQAQLHCCLLN